MAININNPETIAVRVNSDNTIIDPFTIFDDSLTTGKIATFDFYEDSFDDDIEVLLFDGDVDGAPQTVDNFLSYVNGNDYDNSILHRLVSDFVLQGGGFTVENLEVEQIDGRAPVANEFDPVRSNLEGTIAMAKLPGLPDSATSQWFFNLEDNSAGLDTENGGFTVFGQVLSQDDLEVVREIASTNVFDLTDINNAFANVPLNIEDDGDPNPEPEDDNDYIRLRQITVSESPELTFSIDNNTNPDLVDVSLDSDNNLVFDYQPNAEGLAQITIEATNLLGESNSTTLDVVVANSGTLTLEAGNAQIAYVAYYGRPGDPGGLEFWNDDLEASGISYSPRKGDMLTGDEQMVYDRFTASFGESEEADRIFGNLSIEEKVNQVYEFAFNRTAETGGLNFWTEQIENNGISLTSFALEIALGAQKRDLETINNKISSAQLFSQGIDTDAEINAYQGIDAEIFGRNWLANISDTLATPAEVDSALNELVS